MGMKWWWCFIKTQGWILFFGYALGTTLSDEALIGRPGEKTIQAAAGNPHKYLHGIFLKINEEDVRLASFRHLHFLHPLVAVDGDQHPVLVLGKAGTAVRLAAERA